MARKPLTHAERRQLRLDRWRRPLDGPWDRIRAWSNMMFLDHGILRMAYLNLHRVSDLAWRSAQPAPHQVRGLARRGIRTIVSLRGGQSFGSLPLELDACARAGIGFRVLVLRSRALPGPDEILAAARMFDEIETPVLFHCKSGADRAGFAAALWLMLREGWPVAEAKRQLSLRYGHVRESKTGVLDAFFDTYQQAEAETGIAFLDWVATGYDPEAVAAGFRSTGLGRLIGDRLLNRE